MFLFAAVCALAGSIRLVSAGDAVRGVPPNRLVLYDSGRDFTCLNGAQTFSFDQVNDDYCDCADGSDEPGTPACQNSVFYCENPGYKKMEIPSYRVNDGICDCCDGTDEYGTGKCKDTCVEAGRAMREAAALEKMMRDQGTKVRAELAATGAKLRAERDAKLLELEPGRAELEAKQGVLEDLKKLAEEPEKEAKAVFDTAWDETRNANRAAARTSLFKYLDADGTETIELAEVLARIEFDADADGQVTPEEANTFFDQDADGELNETEAVITFDRFEDEKYEEVKEKFKDAVPLADENKPEYDEDVKAKIEKADSARTLFNEVRDELKKVNTEKDELVKKNEHDYGPDGAWASSDGECYSAVVSEYKYTICPFGQAKQEPKNGGGSTNLGNFKGFTGPEGNKYSKIAFEGGQKCWNGPSRSLTVEVKCGSEGSLSNIIEPSKCEYTGTFRHPAVCEALPAGHDEL
jgi:protein kinase C substrate 80K-H